MPATHTHRIYGGRALVHFHEEGHRYEIEIPQMKLSFEHPSMTTVLKALGSLDNCALMDWAAEQAAEYVVDNYPEWKLSTLGRCKLIKDAVRAHSHSRDNSGRIGTTVHSAIETILRNSGDPYDEFAGLEGDDLLRAVTAMDKAQIFLETNAILPLGIERAFWSPTLGVVGTADLPAVVNGQLAITDWKISKWIGLSYRLQLTGYATLYEEEHPGEKVLDRRVVAFGADGSQPKVETWTRETFADDVACFHRVVQDWRWLVANDRFYRGRRSYDGPLTADQLEAFRALPAVA